MPDQEVVKRLRTLPISVPNYKRNDRRRHLQAVPQHILRHFRSRDDEGYRLKNFRFDLSNPVPQIAEWERLYDKLPTYANPVPPKSGNVSTTTIDVPLLSEHLAAVMLLGALPLRTGDIKVESVYSLAYMAMMEPQQGNPTTWTIETIKKIIISSWNGKFHPLPEKDRPKKGTSYHNLDKKQQDANKTSAIRNKGSNPSHQQQQQPSSSTPSEEGDGNKGRRRRQRRRGKGRANAAQTALTPDPSPTDPPSIQFSLPALLARAPPPPPSRSSVFSANPAGELVIRSQPLLGPDRPTGSHPYREVHGARKLADRLGITPTTQTLKHFEDFAGIASIEEVPVASSSGMKLEDMWIDCNPSSDPPEEEIPTTGWGDVPMDEESGMDFTRQVPECFKTFTALTDLPLECRGSSMYMTRTEYNDHFAYCGVCKGKEKVDNWAPYLRFRRVGSFYW